MGWKSWNDRLSLLVLLGIPLLWVADGYGRVEFNQAAIGATITGWVLVLQFYFRKSKGGD